MAGGRDTQGIDIPSFLLRCFQRQLPVGEGSDGGKPAPSISGTIRWMGEVGTWSSLQEPSGAAVFLDASFVGLRLLAL